MWHLGLDHLVHLTPMPRPHNPHSTYVRPKAQPCGTYVYPHMPHGIYRPIPKPQPCGTYAYPHMPHVISKPIVKPCLHVALRLSLYIYHVAFTLNIYI
jgi:hypothetical protein